MRYQLPSYVSIVISSSVLAEDWGSYGIVPAGAQGLVLEAVEVGTADGTVVSVNKLLGKAHQKWHIAQR